MTFPTRLIFVSDCKCIKHGIIGNNNILKKKTYYDLIRVNVAGTDDFLKGGGLQIHKGVCLVTIVPDFAEKYMYQ